MDQVASWLAGVPRPVLIGVLTSLAIAGLTALAKRPRPADADGWTRLAPTAPVLALTGLSIILALFILFWLVVMIGAIVQDRSAMFAADMANTSWGLLIFAPLLVAMFGWSAVYTFFCRQRFNLDGFEQRFLGRRRFVPWADVVAVRRHWLLGPRLRSRSGQVFQLSEVHRGFSQLIDAATGHGVTIDL